MFLASGSSLPMGMAMLCLAVGVGVLLYREFSGPKSTPGSSSASGDHALTATMEAHAAGLGPFTNLFASIAGNNKPALLAEVAYLGRLLKDGNSFGMLLKKFVTGQVQLWLQDPALRAELIQIVGKGLGLDLTPLLNLTPATATITVASTTAQPPIAPPTVVQAPAAAAVSVPIG